MFFKSDKQKLKELRDRNARLSEKAETAQLIKEQREIGRDLRNEIGSSSTFRRVAKDVVGAIDKHVEFKPQGQQGSMFGQKKKKQY